MNFGIVLPRKHGWVAIFSKTFNLYEKSFFISTLFIDISYLYSRNLKSSPNRILSQHFVLGNNGNKCFNIAAAVAHYHKTLECSEMTRRQEDHSNGDVDEISGVLVELEMIIREMRR